MILKKLLNDKIFPYVQKPSRYIGMEQGAVKKELSGIPLKFALAFPDFYELGMSHIGMGIIYDILNSEKDIACERVYLPYPDMVSKLKENKIPLFSLESSEEIKKFDIVGFSLQYELSYTNILLMLEMSGIPVMSNKREYEDPLIGAGGPCTFNPLPLYDFIDFFIIGDGEKTTVEVCKTVLKTKDEFFRKRSGQEDLKDYRRHIKKLLSSIDGIYVPEISKYVKKSIVYDLNSINYIQKPIVPLIEIVHNRLPVEIARGCAAGCRFCQAGYIYRPVRERNRKNIMETIKNGIENTGFEEISLSSLSTGDYSEIDSLVNDACEFTSEKMVSMSFPSMRIGSLSENILQRTAEVKKTNFTLAPETGTERLRKIINKNISQETLLDEVKTLVIKGFKNLKLYFMIGLPYEKISDLDGIKKLILKIKNISKKLNITVNVNNFVPKPHTPFQWHPMAAQDELNFKIGYLKFILKPLNVNFRYQNPKISLIEGLISRGDVFTSKIIHKAYYFGAAFDSESKLFKYDSWTAALNSFKNTGLTAGEIIDKYLYREMSIDKPLPWDFIDTRVDKEYLKNEYKKTAALNRLLIYDPDLNDLNNIVVSRLATENCRKVCHLCGVCDFKEIEPVYSSGSENIKKHKKDAESGKNIKTAINKTAAQVQKGIKGELKNSPSKMPSKLLVRYSKKGELRYLGHIETVKVLLRAFKVSGAEPVYGDSKFSPKPKVSYSDPIPFMSESNELYMLITVKNYAEHESDITMLKMLKNLKNKVNSIIPEGLEIKDIYKVAAGFKIKDAKTFNFNKVFN